MPLASAIQECMYLQQMFKGIDKYKYAKVKVFNDNQGALAPARNPVCRQMCKYIDIKCHFMHYAVNKGRICLKHCSTDNMIADLMKKLQKFARYLLKCMYVPQ